MVLQLPYRSSVSEVMHRQLHWLDVVHRVNYKIGLLVYKYLHGLAPGYLSHQCIPASSFAGRANMCSSTSLDRLLYAPRTKTKTLGHTRVLLRLYCRVELAPGGQGQGINFWHFLSYHVRVISKIQVNFRVQEVH